MINNNKIFSYKFFRSLLLFFFSSIILISFTNLFFSNLHGVNLGIGNGLFFHLTDDPMINFRASYNFWLTGKPYINIEEPVSAISTLFWPIIISPIYFFVKHEFAIIIFYLGSVFLYSLIVFLISYYEENDFKALLKTLLLLLTPATQNYATSFWEHVPQSLLITFSFLIIYDTYQKTGKLKISNLAFLVLCASFLMRPDSAPLIAVIGFYWIKSNFFNDNKKKEKYLSILTGFICSAFLALYVYGMIFYFGDIKPNTAYLKILSLSDSIFLGIKYIISPHSSNLWFYVFLFIIFYYSKINLAQRLFVKCIFAQIIYIIYVGGDTFQNARFFILIIPILIILFFDTLEFFLNNNTKKKYRLKVQIFIITFFLLGQFINYSNIREYLLFKTNTHPSLKYKDRLTSQLILANSINKNLNPSDGSIGLHHLGISYHLPNFHIIDFLGKSDKHIARTKYKNLAIGHNKWDYDYAFNSYDIAAIPVFIWVYEEVKESTKNGEYEGNSAGFWIEVVEYILKSDEYEFLYPSEIGIKEELSFGIFVRKDLINNFIKN